MMEIAVKNGIITAVSLADNAINKRIGEKIQGALAGASFNTAELYKKIAGINVIPEYQRIVTDIAESIKNIIE